VNKLAYRLGEPQRGDVVVFHNPANPKEDYIKRIVGLPGDTVDFRDGIAYVNGLPLDEPYVNPPTRGAISGGPTVIPDDHLFVMGDNRPNSRDSRAFGALEQELVVGKAWVRVWPVSEWGRVGHIDLIPGQPSTVEAAQ
jgi:signal peptidase I